MRHSAACTVALVLVGLVFVGCANDPLRPEPVLPLVADIDDSAQWSNDGRWIAYHRRFPSSDGPPGLYIIPSKGGAPRFLAPGDFFSPTYLRFSPDDRYVSCTRGIQLLLVDLQTGAVLEPLYTANGVVNPDWSPDGRRIVYSRLVSYPGDPLDSLGLYVFDTVTGTEQPVSYQGEVQIGRFPVWAADGRLAMVQPVNEVGVPFHFRISVLSSDGSSLSNLVESPPGVGGLGSLRKYVNAARGLNGLAFTGMTPLGGGHFFINWDGSGMHRLPPTYNYFDSYSPDGSLGVGPRLDPEGALLWIFSTGDISGASSRQLTYYTPPIGTIVVAALDSTRNSSGFVADLMR